MLICKFLFNKEYAFQNTIWVIHQLFIQAAKERICIKRCIALWGPRYSICFWSVKTTDKMFWHLFLNIIFLVKIFKNLICHSYPILGHNSSSKVSSRRNMKWMNHGFMGIFIIWVFRWIYLHIADSYLVDMQRFSADTSKFINMASFNNAIIVQLFFLFFSEA